MFGTLVLFIRTFNRAAERNNVDLRDIQVCNRWSILARDAEVGNRTMKCWIPTSTSFSISDAVSSCKSLQVSFHVVILELCRLTPSGKFFLGVVVQLDAVETAMLSTDTTFEE